MKDGVRKLSDHASLCKSSNLYTYIYIYICIFIYMFSAVVQMVLVSYVLVGCRAYEEGRSYTGSSNEDAVYQNHFPDCMSIRKTVEDQVQGVAPKFGVVCGAII